MPRIITRAIAVEMDKSALVGDGTGNAPTGIASVSCIGYDDPLNHRGGFDLIAQGMGGIIHLTVEPDGSPTIVGLPISDICTGMFSAHGVLAALWQREKTGEGCLLETSLLETSIGLSSWTSAGWLAQESPLEPTRQGSRNRQNAPYQRFTTGDSYIMIGAGNETIWTRCAPALGHTEWVNDPRWLISANRVKNREALEVAIEQVLTINTTDHWVDVLESGNMVCGTVDNYQRLFSDPKVIHRGMVVRAEDDELGTVKHIRSPIRMTGA